MSKFKIGLTIVFTAFIIIGVLVFATSKGVASTPHSSVTIWGFLPQSSFSSFMQTSDLGLDKNLSVTYVQKTPQNFQNDFVNALANGVGPDVIMVSQDMILKNKNKIFTIPFANYSERTFKDSFVQEGELFLSSDGVIAVPFMIDPLVMYWNRDIFNTASLPNPPKYFDEFLTLPTTLSKVDRSGNVTQSAAALGEWKNVSHAKAILSDLIFSANGNVVNPSTLGLQSSLSASGDGAVSPTTAALNFYTQFANPTSQTYSWNRSLPNSLNTFLSGNLAVYFGFASELPAIRAKNPNLNFDVAFMPQARQSTKKVVFANIYGLAIVKQSPNPTGAFQAITDMTTDNSLKSLENYTFLPPVKRFLLASAPADAFKVIFYQSALFSTAWLDPNSDSTDQIFQTMIESVTTGRLRVSEAIYQASQALDSLLGN